MYGIPYNIMGFHHFIITFASKKMYIECATQVNGFKITFKYNLRCLKVGNNIFSTQEYNQFITLPTLRHPNLYFKAFQILIIKY